MQTSAKTKAQEFINKLSEELPYECDINMPYGKMIKMVEKLLLEHERDTRYTAIDVINNMDSELVYDTLTGTTPHINTEDAIQKIHNMKVGE